ncbi:MAG TPA: type II toxin-antitoxin system RelE/ParE family toxin, partial [Terriglobales bacterium]
MTEYSIYGILNNMVWEVEVTEKFEAWWSNLSLEEQEEISAKVELLEERGPTLPRPHVDRIHQSRHQNMKELRGELGGKSEKEYLRVLFAFDPRRIALL